MKHTKTSQTSLKRHRERLKVQTAPATPQELQALKRLGAIDTATSTMLLVSLEGAAKIATAIKADAVVQDLEAAAPAFLVPVAGNHPAAVDGAGWNMSALAAAPAAWMDRTGTEVFAVEGGGGVAAITPSPHGSCYAMAGSSAAAEAIAAAAVLFNDVMAPAPACVGFTAASPAPALIAAPTPCHTSAAGLGPMLGNLPASADPSAVPPAVVADGRAAVLQVVPRQPQARHFSGPELSAPRFRLSPHHAARQYVGGQLAKLQGFLTADLDLARPIELTKLAHTSWQTVADNALRWALSMLTAVISL